MEKFLYAIPNRCSGCNRCTYACSAAREGMFRPALARIKITNFPEEGYAVPNICFQCPKPDCLKACPCEAISQNERGIVVIDTTRCDGCGNCVTACPYGMIEQYRSNIAYKCDLCGGAPVCVAECHYGALVFKKPDAQVRRLRALQMKQRIQKGGAAEKRFTLAKNILDTAVRIPKTAGYMG